MCRKTRCAALLALAVGLTACGDEGAGEPTPNEAYSVGYDAGIADECGREGVRRGPMPSAYDDSMGEGVLASAFQAGYHAARDQAQPCRYPSR